MARRKPKAGNGVPDERDAGRSQSLHALLGLRDLIYSGQAMPGERLSEVVMAERLGLSRTPVRAALARLEQEGLLEAIATGGYAVRGFTEADIIDAIELRGVLEGTAARLAAERGVSPGRLAALEALLCRLDAIVGVNPEALDFASYVDLNAEFHDMLADLPGSPLIRREIDRVRLLPFAGHSAFLDKQADVPAFRRSLLVGQAHHRAIAKAIAQREGARAEAVAREHARLARANLDLVMGDAALRKRMPALLLVAGD